MRSIGYPKLDEHKEMHSRFSMHVLKFTLNFLGEHPDNSKSVLIFLKDWLTGHIMQADKDYAQFAAKQT